MQGCTNPKAANYNPLATEGDGSCIFLAKVDNNCYYFTEVPADEFADRSYTLSFSLESNLWVFYHDYLPDFYIGTREKLFTLKGNNIWKHNDNLPGLFYDGAKKPFFVDVVFNYAQDMQLQSLQWFSKLLSVNGAVDEFSTFTHITVWNDQQCTGKLPITTYTSYGLTGERKIAGEFTWNELRDIVNNRSGDFITDIFSNFRPITQALDEFKPWYETPIMQSNYFIVRLEYDNIDPKTISLQSVDATSTPTVR